MTDDRPRTTRLAGVIGWPIHHSRSPKLHGHWLARYQIDGAFLPLAVKPERLADAVRGLTALGFQGCNVTLPHKQAVIDLLDRLDDTAGRIGAVNTIIVEPDGSLEGRNTDAFGFMENLRAGAPHWQPDRPALVLGAGGAARAVVVGLLEAGCPDLRLTNRTRDRADALRADLHAVDPGFAAPIRVVDWSDRGAAGTGIGLLVNTTTLGMTGQPALEIDLSALPHDAVVADIVYAPLVTPLLGTAKARGLHTVDGVGMLLHQARPGFRAWFGVDPVVDAPLRAAVLG